VQPDAAEASGGGIREARDVSERKAGSGVSRDIVHLVVAMLAVGGYSFQRVWDMLPSLEKEGLADPEIVEQLDEAEVVRRLARSGYDRGSTVTPFMAIRLMALHAAVRQGVLTQACRLMRQGRLQDAETMLCGVKGIGPTVFKHFAMFQGGAK
jgi:hypothetical protein